MGYLTEIRQRIKKLKALKPYLLNASRPKEKLEILNEQAELKEYLERHAPIAKLISGLSFSEQVLIKTVIVIGQGLRIFNQMFQVSDTKKALSHLLNVLNEIENSYDAIGGILGYHLAILQLIADKQQSSSSMKADYHQPPFYDIRKNTPEVRRAVRLGITEMGTLAEIYPVGGAGDRLNLHDEVSGEALPVAALNFLGRPLLEGLIRDLQGREYLHYKLMGKQITTPVAMMVSHDKCNAQHIKNICEEHNWFGRPSESFKFFLQPLVPMVTIRGDWVMQAPLQPMLKPGGHGVIWKQALDSGVLDELVSQGQTHAIVRQINNPISGLDNALCAFLGFGMENQKVFGFASCPRLLNTSEGMDVLLRSDSHDRVNYCITNIEYTEFERHGLHDVPATEKSPYSLYPANTNILFVDLKQIKSTIPQNPFPGMLINMKQSITDVDEHGNRVELQAGRLECTMQNIADAIVDHYPHPLEHVTTKDLSSFVTFNERHKTISVCKKTYVSGESFLETPEGCFYELLQNYDELLTQYCKMHLPPFPSMEKYLKQGPPYLIQMHPALGPLYSVIAQKVRGGKISSHSELFLEIAELDMQHLFLEGSLQIVADSVMGTRDAQDRIKYGENTGKCVLHNVSIQNQGIDRDAHNQYWKHQIKRNESCRIVLQGNAEFYAENVKIQGNQEFVVPDGHRMVVSMRHDKVNKEIKKIAAPTWHWKYTFDSENNVILEKVV